MIKRRIIGLSIRILIVMVAFLPFAILNAILYLIPGVNEEKFDVFINKTIDKINGTLTPWEDNTPERTMDLLKKDFKNEL